MAIAPLGDLVHFCRRIALHLASGILSSCMASIYTLHAYINVHSCTLSWSVVASPPGQALVVVAWFWNILPPCYLLCLPLTFLFFIVPLHLPFICPCVHVLCPLLTLCLVYQVLCPLLTLCLVYMFHAHYWHHVLYTWLHAPSPPNFV
jgi:hypothetical protein